MKRTIEQKELLQELIEHPALPLLVDELESLTGAMVTAMLKYDLSKDDLFIAKCHHDGAHKLVAAFKQRLKTLKPKQDA